MTITGVGIVFLDHTHYFVRRFTDMSAIFMFKMMHDRKKRKERQEQRHLCLKDFKKEKSRPKIKRYINSLASFFTPNKESK